MKKITLIILMLAALTITAAAREFSGRIFLQDSTLIEGDYVMVYCHDFSTGTLADEDGFYSLTLPDTGSNIKLEFSRIGYTTLYKEYPNNGEKITIEDVVLQPQALMLTAAYVTPEGMDPAKYVLSKVWEQSKRSKKKQLNYSADINYTIASHGLTIINEVLPRGVVGLAKFAAAVNGFGPLARYCLNNEDLYAEARLHREVKKGKAKDSGHEIVRSDQKLPKNVTKDILSVFEMIDLFDLVYGKAMNWGENFSKENKITLIGTYEYGNKLVDVLNWKDSKNRFSANVHVVEDEWGILKLQFFHWAGEVLRCEARDVGNGVYMPVSFIMKPSVTMVKAEQIPELIEAVKRNTSIKEKTREKVIKVLERNLGHDFNPYISCGFNIKYDYIEK